MGNFHYKDSLEKSKNELNTVKSLTDQNYEDDTKNASLTPEPTENLIKEIVVLKLGIRDNDSLAFFFFYHLEPNHSRCWY